MNWNTIVDQNIDTKEILKYKQKGIKTILLKKKKKNSKHETRAHLSFLTFWHRPNNIANRKY